MEKLQQDSINDYFYLIAQEDCFFSFRNVYDHYYNRLFASAMHCLNDSASPDAAQKAVIDVFVSLWINRKGLNKVSDLDSYLFLSLKNVIISQKDKTNFDLSKIEIADFQSNPESEKELNISEKSLNIPEKHSAENTFDIIEERISDTVISKMKRKNLYLGIAALVVILAAFVFLFIKQ